MQIQDKIVRKKWLVILILVVITLLTYSNIFANDFAADDVDFFTRWEGVTSLRNIPSFFSGNLPTYHQHVYRPVRSTMQSVVYFLVGQNPVGYHIFSLLIHILAVLFIYLIAVKVFNRQVGYFSALIFSVLPVHVESITFMTASFDISGIVFLLVSFYLYVLFQKSPRSFYMFGSVLTALLAFFTYELTLVLPLLIILYDSCLSDFSGRQLIARFKYYSLYFIGICLMLVAKFGIVGQTYKGSIFDAAPFISRMLTASKALIAYIYLVIINFPLSFSHNLPISDGLDLYVLGSVIAILSLVALSIYLFKKNKKVYTFLFWWFFISLAPVLNVIPLPAYVSERYLYLASVAWALLLGLLFYKMSKRSNGSQQYIIIFIFLTVLIVYGYLTWQRNSVWRNDESLYSETIEQNPEYAFGYNGLAFYYRDQGNLALAEEKLRQSTKLFPEYHLSYNSLGNLYMMQERYDEAIAEFNKAIALAPVYVSSYLNRGVSHYNLGLLAAAEADYLRAIAILPNYQLAHKNLGVVYIDLQKFEEARKHLKIATELLASDFHSFYGLGLSQAALGEVDKAKQNFQRALKINPSFAPAQDLLDQLRELGEKDF
jgi:protein O-mannosyl-transferase